MCHTHELQTEFKKKKTIINRLTNIKFKYPFCQNEKKKEFCSGLLIIIFIVTSQLYSTSTRFEFMSWGIQLYCM